MHGILPSTPVPIQDLKRDGFGPELNLPDTPPSPTESYNEGPVILEQVNIREFIRKGVILAVKTRMKT